MPNIPTVRQGSFAAKFPHKQERQPSRCAGVQGYADATEAHQVIRGHSLDNSVQHLQQRAASSLLNVCRVTANSHIEDCPHSLQKAVPVNNEVLSSGDGQQGTDDRQLHSFGMTLATFADKRNNL